MKRLPKYSRPRDEWNDPPADAGTLLKQIAGIRAKIEKLPPDVWKRAFKFLTDVDNRLAGISETVTEGQRASARQQEAVGNWSTAIDKLSTK